MKLRARWIGMPPKANDYLMSPTRPRYAYRVCSVEHGDSCVTWDPAQRAEVRRLAIVVDRVAITAVPATARIHAWRWDKRAARTR